MTNTTPMTSLPPLFNLRGQNYYRIQGVEKYVIGSRHLFFANSNSAARQFGPSGVRLEAKEWFASGTFRNSLYIEPLAQLTPIRDLSLVVDFEGAMHFKLMCAVRGKPTEVLSETKLVSSDRTLHLLSIGSPTDLPENCRLFWHADALAGGCTIYDANYCTRTAPANTRLAVLLRTFGRTTDVKALLKRFADAGQQDPFYASLLDRMDFWVLDTTTGADGEYTSEWADALNLKVLVGPNLGGGGNAGHMLKLFNDDAAASSTPPTEVLILDDDLSLSMESLARYFMFVAYRGQEFICSLPILMKSQPLTVWEDGGFWGRLNFHEGGNYGRKRNLFPNLLKHGTQLGGYDHLDDFGPLNTCEYSTFIFFGLSMQSLQKLGYPASFFLRGDDIELSLRANAQGLQMITNPNLAAWHEPAHSYGQEYMAILHGVIINLTYSDAGADFYTRFFEERLYEHASLDDLTGIALYRDILSELLNAQSQVLTPDFQQHYLPKLKQFGSVKQMKIPESDRVNFEQRARDNKTLLVPFVYPGYHKDTKKHTSVVLINHSAKAYRELPAVSTAEKAKLSSEYLALIAQLDAEFERVRTHWQQRLKETSSELFWNAIQTRYASETQAIYATQRNGQALAQRMSDVLLLTTPLNSGSFFEEVSATAKVRASLATASAQPASSAAGFTSVSESRVTTDESTAKQAIGGSATTTLAFAGAQLDAEEAQDFLATDETGTTQMLPMDFDPEHYLVINADVKAAGLDPAQHYLNHGRREGRQYKD